MTNLERIQNMNAEEMIEFLYQSESCAFCISDTCHNAKNCKKGIEKWLESEVEE